MIFYPKMKVALTADIPAFAQAWRNQPLIWKWCRQNTLISSPEQEKWEREIDPAKNKMFGILSVDDGSEYSRDRHVGVCGLTNIDRLNQRAEFSVLISLENQRSGYGRDALLSLLRHGFHDHNLNCIWGETFEGNPAIKMFEQLEMKKEGYLRERYFREGKFIGTFIYSLLRSDFARLDHRYFGDAKPSPAPDDNLSASAFPPLGMDAGGRRPNSPYGSKNQDAKV